MDGTLPFYTQPNLVMDFHKYNADFRYDPNAPPKYLAFLRPRGVAVILDEWGDPVGYNPD